MPAGMAMAALRGRRQAQEQNRYQRELLENKHRARREADAARPSTFDKALKIGGTLLGAGIGAYGAAPGQAGMGALMGASMGGGFGQTLSSGDPSHAISGAMPAAMYYGQQYAREGEPSAGQQAYAALGGGSQPPPNLSLQAPGQLGGQQGMNSFGASPMQLDSSYFQNPYSAYGVGGYNA